MATEAALGLSGSTVYVLHGDDGEADYFIFISVHSTFERARARQALEAQRKTNPGSAFEGPMWHDFHIDEVIVDAS